MAEEKEAVKFPKLEYNWGKVLFHFHFHVAAVYGAYLLLTEATWSTLFVFLATVFWGLISITIGCHRLWTHRTYEAVWPLKAFYAVGQLLVCNGSILTTVTRHRQHHKYHGTDLDPNDYRRGFFFSQYTSHCLSKNEEQEKTMEEVSIDDLVEENIIHFQDLFYIILMPIVGILLPSNLVMAYFGESLYIAIFVMGFLRVAILLNLSWLINSGYIIWGLDPLDKRSSDTWLVFFFNKSLWPQYHYLLPWDYRSGEYGTYNSGFCTAILRVFAALGLATGLTTISCGGVKKAMAAAAESGETLVKCLEEYKIVLKDIINKDPDDF